MTKVTVTVKLISDFGQRKAGQDLDCHPNLVPILVAKGAVAGEFSVPEVEVPEATKVKRTQKGNK
jgi:hypothetical protein